MNAAISIKQKRENTIPLGTLEVRKYINSWNQTNFKNDYQCIIMSKDFETIGPRFRYQNVLYVEKEGFNELLERSGLLKKYDLALMSTKGLPTTAARYLIQELSAREDVTIYVLHDFDEAGIRILRCLTAATKRFKFTSKPKIVDLGLRLADVQQWNLQSEDVIFKNRKKDPRITLEKWSIPEEERNFLVSGRDRYSGAYKGKRVEINALMSNELLDFLENKFKEYGLEKVIPDEQILKDVYKYARFIDAANETIRDLRKIFDKGEFKHPEDLRKAIVKEMNENPTKSWDEIIMNMTSRDWAGLKELMEQIKANEEEKKKEDENKL